MVAVHKLERHGQVFSNKLIHLVLNFLFFLLRGLMVENIADFALLTLDVGIVRPLTTEHAHHYLIEQMLGSVGWRELFLVVHIECIAFFFHLYLEFIGGSSPWHHIGREGAITFEFNRAGFSRKQVHHVYFPFCHLEEIESMAGNVHATVDWIGRKIRRDKYRLVVLATQKGVLLVGIEVPYT